MHDISARLRIKIKIRSVCAANYYVAPTAMQGFEIFGLQLKPYIARQKNKIKRLKHRFGYLT